VRVPVLKQGPYLIASVQSALTDEDLIQLRDDLANMVGKFHSTGIVIDVTALDVMDSFAARTLRSMAATVRLRGAKAVIVGIQPEVAFAMVQLGLSLSGVPTGLDLEDGLALLEKQVRGERGDAG
jgi:rsbT antagonist protein RsbS